MGQRAPFSRQRDKEGGRFESCRSHSYGIRVTSDQACSGRRDLKSAIQVPVAANVSSSGAVSASAIMRQARRRHGMLGAERTHDD